MKYGILINDRYIIGLSKGGGKEITESEYNEISAIIRNHPTAPEGYGYRLTVSLEWELYELPAVEDADEELPDSEALEIIVNGGAV